jgi:hypothetical protein
MAAQQDILLHMVFHNFMSAAGWVNALQLVRRLMRGGLTHWATVCSTWIWMARSGTLRSEERPLGKRPWSDKVAEANAMVSRMIVLLYLIVAQDSFFILEQPANSLMVKVPRMVQLKKRLGNHWSSIHTYMGEFGGETPKPTRLWSNHKGIRNLVRTLNPSKYEKSNLTVIDAEKKAAGIAAVTGSKSELKMSQAYPLGYGKAVHELYATSSQQHTHPQDEEMDEFENGCEPSASDLWDDAWMTEIAAWMKLPKDKLAI